MTYVPYGAADALMGCRDDEVLLEGPAGTGKSRAALQKLHTAALKYPRMRGLIIRQTRESLTESVLVTYEEKVLPLDSPIAAGAKRDSRKSYDYPNGSSIVVGGIKAYGKDASAKVMSTEYDLIVVFEGTELSEAEYEKLLTRLRNGVMPYQQIIVDCNPAGPLHWLNQRANRGAITRLLSRHKDNPFLYDQKTGERTAQGETYLSKLSRLTGARFLRLMSGKWAAAEGVVYPGFDAAVHVIEPFEIPSHWRRIRAIDFGYTNPFVCQWWAIDPDGRMYLYREIYRVQTLVEDHAKRILELTGDEKIEATVADHDAEDRATLSRHGVETLPAFKAVTPGIQAVEGRLRIAGDKKARLYIFRGARADAPDEKLVEAKKPACTEEEFDGYMWPKGADGKPLKEEPVKENDHGMDPMRYGAAYADDLAHTRFEVEKCDYVLTAE